MNSCPSPAEQHPNLKLAAYCPRQFSRPDNNARREMNFAVQCDKKSAVWTRQEREQVGHRHLCSPPSAMASCRAHQRTSFSRSFWSKTFVLLNYGSAGLRQTNPRHFSACKTYPTTNLPSGRNALDPRVASVRDIDIEKCHCGQLHSLSSSWKTLWQRRTPGNDAKPTDHPWDVPLLDGFHTIWKI